MASVLLPLTVQAIDASKISFEPGTSPGYNIPTLSLGLNVKIPVPVIIDMLMQLQACEEMKDPLAKAGVPTQPKAPNLAKAEMPGMPVPPNMQMGMSGPAVPPSAQQQPGGGGMGWDQGMRGPMPGQMMPPGPTVPHQGPPLPHQIPARQDLQNGAMGGPPAMMSPGPTGPPPVMPTPVMPTHPEFDPSLAPQMGVGGEPAQPNVPPHQSTASWETEIRELLADHRTNQYHDKTKWNSQKAKFTLINDSCLRDFVPKNLDCPPPKPLLPSGAEAAGARGGSDARQKGKPGEAEASPPGYPPPMPQAAGAKGAQPAPPPGLSMPGESSSQGEQFPPLPQSGAGGENASGEHSGKECKQQ